MATEPNFDRLLDPFDQSLIENKQGKSYIGHEHIRLRVIEATGNQFDWEVTSVDYRIDGVVRMREKSGEIPPVMVVTGRLTIPGLGVRTGMGVQVLESGAGEDAYKGAESDAFKRAAMAFGVGLHQLYVLGGKPDPVSSHRATSRPDTRQHKSGKPANMSDFDLPQPVKSTMPDDVFGPEVRRAITDKDGALFRALVDEAGEHVGRWITMVKAADSKEAIEWIERQVERRQMASPLLLEEISRTRGRLGVGSSSSSRQARRDNALPGFTADEVEAGRAAADRATR